MTSPRGKDHNAVVPEQTFTQLQRIPGRSYEKPVLRCGWPFYPAQVVFLTAVYYGAAKLGLTMAFVAKQVTAVLPPTGIALAALLVFGYRAWPGIALGALLANATTNTPLATAAGIALGNTLDALVGAWLLRRLVQFDPALERVKAVLGLVVLAAGVSTMVSATIGATSLYLGGVKPCPTYSTMWSVWWLGDAMGDLVVAPLLLTWAGWHCIAWWPRQVVEAGALLLGLVAVSLLVFAGPTAAVHRGAAACPDLPSGAGSAEQSAGRSRLCGRRDVPAGGGGAAASLPAAAATRPAGGRPPLHLAHPAHQGGGGSRRPDAADCGTPVLELAAPRLESPGGRARAQSSPDACPPAFRLTRWTACRRVFLMWGEGGGVSLGPVRPGRSSVTNGPDAPGWRQNCGCRLSILTGRYR
jgi:hypothetical protein